MAKLMVVLETQFEAGPLRVHDKKTFKEVTLDAAGAAKLFSKVPKEELEIEVVSGNEDAEMSTPVKAKNGKKGAIFNISMPDGAAFVVAEIKGEFTVDLRAGAGEVLKSAGKGLDLRLRGVMWKGGAYSGFMAPVRDSDYDQESSNWANTFPTVESFLVK